MRRSGYAFQGSFLTQSKVLVVANLLHLERIIAKTSEINKSIPGGFVA